MLEVFDSFSQVEDWFGELVHRVSFFGPILLLFIWR